MGYDGCSRGYIQTEAMMDLGVVVYNLNIGGRQLTSHASHVCPFPASGVVSTTKPESRGNGHVFVYGTEARR